MAEIKILGTSHISKESIKELKKEVKDFLPDIIAIELDKERFFALKNNLKSKPSITDIKKIGILGYLFTLIGGWAQKKLGASVGMKPGSEMKTAINLAQKNNLKLALIDQNIRITMKRLSKCTGWQDIKGFFKEIWKREKISFDLTKVPPEKIIEELIERLRDTYPGLYKSLIHERNIFMVKKLKALNNNFPDKKILAVVGAGHKKEMEKMLSKTTKINSSTNSSLNYTLTYS